MFSGKHFFLKHFLENISSFCLFVFVLLSQYTVSCEYPLAKLSWMYSVDQFLILIFFLHASFAQNLFAPSLFHAFNSQIAWRQVPILCLAHLDDTFFFSKSAIIGFFSCLPISYQDFKYANYLLEYPYFTASVPFFFFLNEYWLSA